MNQPLGWLPSVSISRSQPAGGVAVLAGQVTVVAMVLDMGHLQGCRGSSGKTVPMSRPGAITW